MGDKEENKETKGCQGDWREARGERWEDRPDDRGNRFKHFFSLYRVGLFICLLISPWLTLSVYLRTAILALSHHTETGRGAQRWFKHISRGNLPHPGGVYAAKPINSRPVFLSSTACKKASSAAVCLKSIPWPHICCFPSFSCCPTSCHIFSLSL